MASVTIPVVTLTPNEIIDSSTTPALTQPVGVFTDFQLVVNRNAGSSPLDSTNTASIQIFTEWSADNEQTWNLGISAVIPGGPIFADKAQTIRQETSSIDWPFASALAASGIVPTHIRGRVVNGAVAVSVSGSATLS